MKRTDLQRLEGNEALKEPPTLWTYVHELNRRAHFASQGLTVRAPWFAMDQRQREKISSGNTLKSRAVLVEALRSANRLQTSV